MISTQRIEERMAELGLNPHSTAKRAGLGQDYVRDLLRGKVKQPSAARLRELAIALQCSPEYLMGLGQEPGEIPFSVDQGGRPAKLSVDYVIRSGYFESSDSHKPDRDQAYWVISAIADDDEWLERVVDDQVGQFAAGELVHVVHPTHFHSGLTEYVIVVRSRDGGKLHQRSIQRVRFSERGASFLHLWTRTPLTWADLVAGKDPEYGKIVGLVLRSYQFFDGGHALDEIPF